MMVWFGSSGPSSVEMGISTRRVASKKKTTEESTLEQRKRKKISQNMCIKHNKEALLPHTKYIHCGLYIEISKSEWRGRKEPEKYRKFIFYFIFTWTTAHSHRFSLLSIVRRSGGEQFYFSLQGAAAASGEEWVVCVRKSIPKKNREKIQTYAVDVVVFSEYLLFLVCSEKRVDVSQPKNSRACSHTIEIWDG